MDGTVARIERRRNPGRSCHDQGYSRISLMLNAGYGASALRPGAARLASRHIGSEDRRVDRAGGVLDVLRQERTRGLGVTRKRRLHDLLVLLAQAAPRDRTPQHGAVPIA